MNIFTKLYEKLFVPEDVRKLHVIGYHYSKKSSYNTLGKYATVSLSANPESNDWIEVCCDYDVTVYKNSSDSVTANLKCYSRLVDLAYAAHLAEIKATRLTEAEKARVAVQAGINEIFADILKD